MSARLSQNTEERESEGEPLKEGNGRGGGEKKKSKI